jgi:hypothetical protein
MGICRPVCEGASLSRKAPACVGTVTAGASVDRVEATDLAELEHRIAQIEREARRH